MKFLKLHNILAPFTSVRAEWVARGVVHVAPLLDDGRAVGLPRGLEGTSVREALHAVVQVVQVQLQVLDADARKQVAVAVLPAEMRGHSGVAQASLVQEQDLAPQPIPIERREKKHLQSCTQSVFS